MSLFCCFVCFYWVWDGMLADRRLRKNKQNSTSLARKKQLRNNPCTADCYVARDPCYVPVNIADRIPGYVAIRKLSQAPLPGPKKGNNNNNNNNNNNINNDTAIYNNKLQLVNTLLPGPRSAEMRGLPSHPAPSDRGRRSASRGSWPRLFCVSYHIISYYKLCILYYTIIIYYVIL